MATGDKSEDLVLVTGASGFIATHIVQQLLEQGYRVRGTVRSLEQEHKVRPLRELCPGARHPLELVEADLTKADTWLGAVAGCTLVLHTASPFPLAQPRDEQEVIGPAVSGVRAVLRAATEACTVRRVVLTSSLAAVGTVLDRSGQFTAADWADPANPKANAYTKSKTLAERAAWDYVKEHQDDFELAVINPSYVMGPVLCGSFGTSMEVPKRLLEHAVPFVPKVCFPLVDVRDVAAAHIKAMTLPEAAGKRYILSTGPLWFREIAQILKAEFGPLGYKVPTAKAPNWVIKFAGQFDKGIRVIVPALGKVADYDNSPMKEQLGIHPRELKDTVIDMTHSMIERGFIKKAKKSAKSHGQD